MKEAALYTERKADYNQKISELEKRAKVVSWLRLVFFLLSHVVPWFFEHHGFLIFSILFAVPLTVFVYLIKRHAQMIRELAFLRKMRDINEKEEKALQGNFSVFANGKEYLEESHAYCNDLDFFGDDSLFQYLNRCSLPFGEQSLSGTLKKIELDKETIRSRQNAIKELSSKLEWRQSFSAYGQLTKASGAETNRLEEWFKEEVFFKKPGFILFINILLPLLTLSALGLLIADKIHMTVFLLLSLSQIGIAGAFLHRITRYHDKISRMGNILQAFGKLFRHVEKENFESEFLKNQKERMGDGDSVSLQLKRLGKIIQAMDARLNMIAGIVLNGLLMWDLWQVYRAEKWKKKSALTIRASFEALGQLDTMNSLANYAFNNDEFVYPEFSKKEDCFIEALSLGHPLIPAERRISNDFRMSGVPDIHIITGANMAGKSTWLRTLGTNIILAGAGAPVCAASFTYTPVDVFSGIRIRDNLAANESYFYAELKRLSELIKRLQSGQHLFVILDEMLQGTNSKDKQTGSMALVRQLSRLKTNAVIATHDLELGKLKDELPGICNNYCFEVELSDEGLVFDYLLREGISQNLNASILMKQMGIIPE